MRKILFTLIYFVSFSILTYGQVSDSLITSDDQGIIWLNKLEETHDLNTQLLMLRKRILLDTNLYVPSTNCTITLSDKSKIKSVCRLMVTVNDMPYYFDTKTNSLKIEAFLYYITDQNIESIEILEPEKAMAMFGTFGACGIVALKTTNKKVLKKMRKLFR